MDILSRDDSNFLVNSSPIEMQNMIVVEILLIPMKVGTDSGLIPGSDSDVIPGVFGAKRRWPSYRA